MLNKNCLTNTGLCRMLSHCDIVQQNHCQSGHNTAAATATNNKATKGHSKTIQAFEFQESFIKQDSR